MLRTQLVAASILLVFALGSSDPKPPTTVSVHPRASRLALYGWCEVRRRAVDGTPTAQAWTHREFRFYDNDVLVQTVTVPADAESLADWTRQIDARER